MKKWEKYKWDLIENIKIEKQIAKGFVMRQDIKKKSKTKAFDDISDSKY